MNTAITSSLRVTLLTVLSALSYGVEVHLQDRSWMGAARLIVWTGFSFMVFRNRGKQDTQHLRPWYWQLLALALSAIVVLGNTGERTRGLFNVFVCHTTVLAYAMMIIGRAPFYHALFALMYGAVSAGGPGCGADAQKPRLGEWLKIAGALLVCWLPYMVLCFPGAISWDAGDQMQQALGLQPLSNMNPVMQTLWIRWCLNIGRLVEPDNTGIFLYTITQTLACSMLFAGMLMYGRYVLRMRRGLGVLVFLYLALHPVIPMYAICMGKDTNFGVVLLLFSMLLHGLCTPQGAFLKRHVNMLLLGLSAALLVVLRNAGLALAVVSLLVVLRRFLGGRDQRGATAVLFALLCAVGAHVGVRAWVAAEHILPNPRSENYAIPIQIAGRAATLEPRALTPARKAAIDAVLPVARLADSYVPDIADPLKALWRKGTTEQQDAAFMKAVMAISCEHPAIAIGAMFNMAYRYLTPGAAGPPRKAHFFVKYMDNIRDLAPVCEPFDIGNARRWAHRALNRLPALPGVRLFVSPGLFSWIVILCFLFTLPSKEAGAYACLVPYIMFIVGCCFTPVNGYYRYMIAVYFGAPWCLMVCQAAVRRPGQPGDGGRSRGPAAASRLDAPAGAWHNTQCMRPE